MKPVLVIVLLFAARMSTAQAIDLGPSTQRSVQWLTVKVPQAPLAFAASVTGTVQVEIAFKGCKLDPDSVHVVNRRGDAPQYKKMLEDAALDAVKHSEIGCGDFRDAKTVLTYEFALKSPGKCYTDEATEFSVHNNVIRVVAPARCVETSGSPAPHK